MGQRAFIAIVLFLAFCAPGVAQDSAKIAARYKQMLAKNPGEGTALDRLWKICQDQSATAQLLDEYKAAAEKNDFSASLIYGLLLRKAGETDGARTIFQRAAALNPQSPLPHLALAEMASAQTNPKEAANEYGIAAGLMHPADSALPDVLLKLGAAWLSAGDTAKASEAWERTVALDPENLGLRQRLAENYVVNNLPDKAVPHYEWIAANGDAPQRAQALERLARVHQMKGDTDAAIQSLDRAIALTAPGNWLRGELQERLIRLYQRSHRTAELERLWKKYAAENPRDLGAYVQLVDLYERLGDAGQERAWLEKLSALAPKNQDYKIKLARLCEQLGQPERAAELFDLVLKEQPANADVLFARAELDARRGAAQAARDRIEALLQQHNDDESLRARAVGFYSRHRLFDAVEARLKAGAAHDENTVLALADFYFSQLRPADAKRTLGLLVKSGDAPDAQASAHAKIAGVLKEHAETQGALEELRQAIALQPLSSREYHLALGDMLLGLSRFDDAQAEVEKAFQLSRDEPARMETDGKLFRIFQTRQSRDEAEKKIRLSGPGGVMEMPAILRRRDRSANPPPDDPLQKYISSMIAAAEKNPAPEAMMRVARWETWSRRNKEAMDFAQRAIDLKPDSIDARELFVKIASTEQKPAAIAQLRELIKIDPAREPGYMTRIGRLEMEAGEAEEAIRLFSDLAASKPGDIDVRADLASALQQIERWDDAAAAWQRAFDLSPASRRKEIAVPLAHALERLGQNQKAAEVFSKAMDDQPDEKQRTGDFQDLLAFCAKHKLLGWLQTRYEQKLRTNADDYFAEIALSKILRATGRDRDSFELLSDAEFSATDQVAAMRDLVGAAEDLGDFAAAIAQQKRIVLLARQDDSADMEKLAALLESNFDIGGADKTWDDIAAKFPLAPAALSHAADFFRRWDFPEKARAVLRRVVALEPADLEALLTLGWLASAAGDNGEALSCYEKILQNSQPEGGGEPVNFPGIKAADAEHLQQTYFATLRLRNGQPNAGTMRALRSFWGSEGGKLPTEPSPRLAAIRAISEILTKGGDKVALRNWIERWQTAQAAQASDALWAFYYSEAPDQEMKLLGDLMRGDPKNRQLEQAFVWFSLKMGRYAALCEWVADTQRSAEERDLLLIALGQLMNGEPGPLDPKLVPGLFPEPFKARQILWQTAVLFASRGHFDEAIQLGGRVFTAAQTQRPAYGVELARWHVCIGDIGGARRVLRSAIAGAGDSPDGTIYAALREYYFLLPENRRDSFIESYARETKRHPLHSALSLSLLYGLQGDDGKAREQITKLIALRPMAVQSDSESTPACRVWNFLLTAGLQFQAWKLDALAADLWQKALADEAGIRLQGDQVAEVVREIRMRLVALRLARADAGETENLLDNFMRTASPETAFTLATVLQNNGSPAQSAKIFQRLWNGNPKNQHFLLSLLNACRAANDGDSEKTVLREALLVEGAQNPPGTAYAQAALQLAARLSNDGENRLALKVLEPALRFFPGNKELLNLAANVHTGMGKYGEAAKLYRQALAVRPDDAQARDSLVRALESAGDVDGAIQALAARSVSGANDDALLARLYLEAGQPDKAEAAANKVLQSRAFEQIPGLAALFIGKGENVRATKLLQITLSRCTDANVLLQLQIKLLESLPADAPPDLIDRQLSRLRSCHARIGCKPGSPAGGVGRGLSFYDSEEAVAKKFHREEPFQHELEAAWRDGAGELDAGLTLARIQAGSGRKEKLRGTCEKLFARADFNEQTFQGLQNVLRDTKQFGLLSKGWETVSRRNPINNAPLVQCARALFLDGRKEDAAAVLEKLGCRHVFDDDVAKEVAQEYVDGRNDAAAAKWDELAVRKDPYARDTSVYCGYAELLIRQKDFPAAKRLLIAALRNSGGGNPAATALVDYFLQSGGADRIETGLREFGLSPGATAEFYAGLIGEYQARHEPLKALAIAEAHPEIVAGKRDIAAILRNAARTGGAFERTGVLLEKVLAQSPDDAGTDVGRELALLYLDWGRQELAASQNSALAHLKRAHELKPENYEIAEALCKLYLVKSQLRQAAEVLNHLIAVSQDKADREKAKTWLSTLPPG